MTVNNTLHHLLQPHHVDELAVGCAGQEMQQGSGRLWGWDLQQCLFKLLAEGKLGSCLGVGGIVQSTRAGEWRRHPVHSARLDVRGKVHIDG